MKRLVCWLIGCNDTHPFEDVPYCKRCGRCWGDSTHRDYSLPARISFWIGRLPHRLTHKCDECHKRVWFRADDFCSDDCEMKAIPF